MKYLSLPTWLFTCVVIRNLKDHPWKGEDGRLTIDLDSWHKCATVVTYALNANIWFSLGACLILIIR